MTTAHRPTFDPARGGTGRNEGDLSKLSQQYSSRDMPSHMKMKYRQKGQSHPNELSKRDLRTEIEYRESFSSSKDRGRGRGELPSSSGSIKKPRFEPAVSTNADADDPLDDLDDSDASDSDSDDDAELMAELERIKKERAAEKATREQREHEEQERIRHENILHGNPLLNTGREEDVNFKVKRRWDDDVVFKNCARGIDERKKEPTFINDAIRSEFHRKFMEKYIK